MTARRTSLISKLGVPVLVFVFALGALTLSNRSPEGSSGASDDAPPAADFGPPPRNTEELIRSLQRRVLAEPDEASGYAQLGDAYLQRTRETSDSDFYTRAEKAFDEALRRDPAELTATIGAGTLALARHDFRGGLRLGLRARRLAPRPFDPTRWWSTPRSSLVATATRGARCKKW